MVKRLFLDMDGTLARFHDQANYLERMYEDGFFRDLEPFENMVEGIRLFMKEHSEVEVYIASALLAGDASFCEKDKNIWLDLYLPEIDYDHRLFTPMGQPKAKYVPGGVTKDDYLVDDYNKGLNQFLYDGGNAIKCHNNINQKGLGAYGGDFGHKWMGHMVHSDDKPEMISAELAYHMGLEYDLSKVVSVYSQVINAPVSIFEYKNPLNALRSLEGKSEFNEVHLKDKDGDDLSATKMELEAVCFNFYGSDDAYSFIKDDLVQFAEDIKEARKAAEMPIVGQIHYYGFNGQIQETQLVYTIEEMKKAAEELSDYGIPAKVQWNISLPKPDITKMGYFELSDKLYYDFGVDHDRSDAVASALRVPTKNRTGEEMGTLLGFWLDYEGKLDMPLPDFLGLSLKDCKKFLVSAVKDHDLKKKLVARKTGLDKLICNARESRKAETDIRTDSEEITINRQ